MASFPLVCNTQTISPNDKVVVGVLDDPAVNGLACYLSHAKTGGYAGASGAADPCQIVLYEE